MSRYDFEIDLSDNTTSGLLMKKIRPGSDVLEFGCATGRMTRYMKEELGCSVRIVEYDREAFEKASAFADDGVCDDILTLSWLERFRELRFDAILFADVLEHLTDPEKALRHAAMLLKENGRILLSVPNITHNDILLKAARGHFDYTRTGLLDDTHVHFWGLENIAPFAAAAGLFLHRLEATYQRSGRTEQFEGEEEPRRSHPLLLNELRRNLSGEVYQFVAVLGKEEPEECVTDLRPPCIFSRLYKDSGEGFRDYDYEMTEAFPDENGRYHARFSLSGPAGIRRLRLDPVEHQGCILTGLHAEQDGKRLVPEYAESRRLPHGVLLYGTDPKLFLTLPEDGRPVQIEAEFIVAGMAFLDELTAALLLSGGSVDERKALEERISFLEEENDRLRKENAAYVRENAGLGAENAALRGSLADYRSLADQKDLALIGYERMRSVKLAGKIGAIPDSIRTMLGKN